MLQATDKAKLNLSQLNVRSFITRLDAKRQSDVLGKGVLTLAESDCGYTGT